MFIMCMFGHYADSTCSLITTQTFSRVLTVSVNSCREIKSALAVA